MLRSLLAICLAALAVIAGACIWDSDTLAMEAKKYPGLIQVITGRFERNPPLYYEMRLERVQRELKDSPDKLELYDDAGVACDRLGRSDEAIEWMDKKKQVLDRKPDREHLYRYHANLGTFLAHKWVRQEERGDLTLLKKGRDHIAKAIEINPDAHFGRERVQLGFMEWALFRLGPKYNPNKGEGRNNLTDHLMSSAADDPKELINGLSGLVVLGNAWESVDVFAAISEIAGYHQDGQVSFFAGLRSKELLEKGQKSLDSKFDVARLGYQLLTDEGKQAKEWFPKLRKEADEWAKRREAYMMERLQAGRHPDTDSTFWSEWRDPGPPEIPARPIKLRRFWSAETLAYIGVGAVGLVVVLLAIRQIGRLRRKAA
jgi:tetratricopeptide (TPR) repeat protein